MVLPGTPGLLLGAIALGAVHGIEPGHGWPVAASYALDKGHKWIHGLGAGLVIGVGHLISSIAMVGLFFYAKEALDLTQINEPVTIFADIQIGGPVSIVAGLLLILLGVREYVAGHSHDHGHESHDSSRSDDVSSHQTRAESVTDSTNTGILARLKKKVSFVDRVGNVTPDDAHNTSLSNIAWFAFLLGFAHEEEFEIIALCAGSSHCLSLMVVYSVTVIAGIVTLTMLLIAGYLQFEEKVEQYTSYLPVFSAAILMVMGLGFVVGIF